MIIAVIMAAGEETGMKSSKPKVMHQVCGYPIIDYVVTAASKISNDPPIVIVGQGFDEIPTYLGEKARYAYQHEPLGTGHGIMMVQKFLEGQEGLVLVLAGNTPLITGDTLERLVAFARQGEYHAVALSGALENRFGYDAPIYCFDIPSLLDSLARLHNDNAQKRYDLMDVLEFLKSSGKRVGVHIAQDPFEISGVNTRIQLAKVNKMMRLRINDGHMENGVTIIDPENTYIGPNVLIGKDAILYPGNVLEGHTVIGEESILYPNNRIVDSVVGKGAQLQSSVILSSEIGEKTTVGPFAYIRPGSIIGDKVRIGDFVEIKNSRIGDGSKVSHLTYIGDGTIGKNVNVGCGVVFVNYDGEKKFNTVVGDDAFIGCNVNLVAPVEIQDNAYIAAGSTITEDVPEGSLAIARSRQVIKEGWVDQRKKERR